MFHSLNGRFDDAPRQHNVFLFFTGLSYSLHLHSSTHTPQSIWIYICSQSRSGAITFLYWAWFLDNSVWRWWVSKTSNWIETRDIVIQIHVFNINLTEKRAPKIARFLLKQWHKFCQSYQLFCQTKKKAHAYWGISTMNKMIPNHIQASANHLYQPSTKLVLPIIFKPRVMAGREKISLRPI